MTSPFDVRIFPQTRSRWCSRCSAFALATRSAILIAIGAGVLTSLAIPVRAGEQAGGATVDSSVNGRAYVWRIENHRLPAVTRVEIDGFWALDAAAPDRWTAIEGEAGFVAEADRPIHGIRRGRTGEFSARARSSNAILSRGTAMITFSDGSTTTADDIWVPLDEGLVVRFLPVACLLALVAFHLAVSRRAGDCRF